MAVMCVPQFRPYSFTVSRERPRQIRYTRCVGGNVCIPRVFHDKPAGDRIFILSLMFALTLQKVLKALPEKSRTSGDAPSGLSRGNKRTCLLKMTQIGFRMQIQLV